MVEMDGVHLHVECSGEGQGVVLLHGWGQDLSMMRLLQCQLQESYRVVNLDLPGFGESIPLREGWGMDDYVTCLFELLNRYEIENPILIAHSFGARIAIRYAARFPVKKMVLTGAAGLRAPLSLWKRAKQKAYRINQKLQLPIHFGSSDYQNADPALKKVLVQAVNEDLSSLLPDIHCPVLLVWGSEDQQTPLWMARKMESVLPQAKLIVYRGEDHFAYYHQGFRFIEDIQQFLGVSRCCG